jgi:hypothetical protein
VALIPRSAWSFSSFLRSPPSKADFGKGAKRDSKSEVENKTQAKLPSCMQMSENSERIADLGLRIADFKPRRPDPNRFATARASVPKT